MKRRSFPMLIFVVAVTILTVFTATNVTAFSDEPCYGLNYNYCAPPLMTQTLSGWQVVLSEPSRTNEGLYDWNYSFISPSGTFVSSNFVAFLIPDCCNGEGKIHIYQDSFPTFSVFPVGQGEPTVKFGIYNQQAFVIKGTPDRSGNWKIVTNTNYKTKSTIIIKSGNNVYQFEMAVPGCPPAPALTEAPIVSTYSECVNFGQDTVDTKDDVSFNITRKGDSKGCIQSLKSCIGPGCQQGTCMPVDPDVTPLPVDYVHRGSFHPATCPDEDLQVSHGSPFYLYDIVSGGARFVSCLDLASYSWCNLNCCSSDQFPTPTYPECGRP